jgi:hypothetical protein
MATARRCIPLILVPLLFAVHTTFALAQVPAPGPEPAPEPDPSDAFFDDSVVHDLHLRIHAADWQKLQSTYLENTYYPCDLVWRGQTVYNVGIRSRGAGSRNAKKPGLRVDFDQFSTDQEFLGLKSFVLDNLTQDSSGLRERLAMKLFRRLGLPASREAHAKLYVNNTYVGLYAVVESIDKRFLKRVEGLDPDGFLFEYRWKEAWTFSYRGQALEAYQPLFSPQTHEKDSTSELYAPLEHFIRVVNNSTDFAREIAEYLNPDNFLKHLAIEQFVAEWDGLTGYAGMNNFYLYRRPKKNECRFLVWDKDNAFKAPDYPVLQGTAENVLTRRLLEIPSWRERYLALLLEVQASADQREGEVVPGAPLPPAWLEQEVARQYLQIRQAMRDDVNKPFTNDDFEGAIAYLREFASARGTSVKGQVAALRGQ